MINVSAVHLPGLILAREQSRRYEDQQFLNFLIRKASPPAALPEAQCEVDDHGLVSARLPMLDSNGRFLSVPDGVVFATIPEKFLPKCDPQTISLSTLDPTQRLALARGEKI